ncbi:sensor histidine kinase [Mucilaginibacter auburnensis]|uniref:Histidine kinase n=1 Tax=Mucilaginibacter auburnensis TaxID=1457233 RepID=A0A2H9VSM3_9SPHI|nr:histidine kinase [Mucilaginibacter auburnensis]PJJ83820.1 histidine kinase [Mucilaginibacter auburnensis]
MEYGLAIEKYNKKEFWVVTACFLLLVLNLLKVTIENGYWSSPAINSIDSYSTNAFLPRFFNFFVLYIAYIYIHFILVKRFLVANNDAIATNILLALVPFATVVLFWTLSDIWKSYSFYYFFEDIRFNIATGIKLAIRNLLKLCFIAGVYIIYSYVKYEGFLFKAVENLSAHAKRVLLESFWAVVVWFVVFRLLVTADVRDNLILLWIWAILPAIPVYLYTSLALIPQIKNQGKDFWIYWARMALIGLVILLLVFVFFLALNGLRRNQTMLFVIAFLYVLFQIAVTVPLSWAVYHHRLNLFKEISGLKTALGQSSANLDFLRSQINPHFLFNALNTLYGTAIQEHADLTGEGIQKLGDMMRFMLHENTQEKISLLREVDYLKNYIDLQKLRTHTSPDIVIQTEIEETINGLQIAPMLLIPFVENAFKHGISLREASYIKISLHTEDNKLFFDIYNSVHQKTGTDPEKNNNGIGLENVKQRLQLLYPDRHELMIRQSGKEYFAHLTVQL